MEFAGSFHGWRDSLVASRQISTLNSPHLTSFHRSLNTLIESPSIFPSFRLHAFTFLCLPSLFSYLFLGPRAIYSRRSYFLFYFYFNSFVFWRFSSRGQNIYYCSRINKRTWHRNAFCGEFASNLQNSRNGMIRDIFKKFFFLEIAARDGSRECESRSRKLWLKARSGSREAVALFIFFVSFSRAFLALLSIYENLKSSRARLNVILMKKSAFLHFLVYSNFSFISALCFLSMWHSHEKGNAL